MSKAIDGGDAGAATGRGARRGRWIDEWDAEDERFWDRGGSRIARKNLRLSIFAEHLGFSIWVLWTIIVINLANNNGVPAVLEFPRASVSKSITLLARSVNGRHPPA